VRDLRIFNLLWSKGGGRRGGGGYVAFCHVCGGREKEKKKGIKKAAFMGGLKRGRNRKKKARTSFFG